MWMTEHTEETNASPVQLWARYAEPARWPEWDHEAEQVTVRGPMAVGTRGRLKPVGGPAVPFVFTSVTPNVEFTDVSRLPMGRLTFAHSIAATATGSRFTHRVTITGLLAPLYRRVIDRGIAAGLPGAMQTLAGLAEGSQVPDAPIRR